MVVNNKNIWKESHYLKIKIVTGKVDWRGLINFGNPFM